MKEVKLFPKQIANLSVKLCENKKGVDVKILDIREKGIVDYFVLCTASSLTHAQAIAEEIKKELRKKNIFVGHIEGMYPGHWILLDYFSVVIHVFTKEVRDFYKLEDLWTNI
ncbi:MAG: ribosome silencing factor [Candidatus Firestonebacteria bacterium]|nr:ribosome silencing factor [Candidatus Firestonebacteria bacterium]